MPFLRVSSAIVVAIAAVRAHRGHAGALHLGRAGVGFLYIVAGAAANVAFVLRGDDYARFADESMSAFVRDTWASLVVPHHDAWISLLIVFEVAVGVLALLGGRRTQLADGLAIAFHVALLPMVVALAALLRAERRAAVAASPAGSTAEVPALSR